MASGTRLTSKARGWREGRPEEAGTSYLTCRIPASLSRCVMTQPCHQELLWGSTCTKGGLRLTCTLSASTFTRSDMHGRGILVLCAVLVDYSNFLLPQHQILKATIITHNLINCLCVRWSENYTVMIILLYCVSRSRVKGQLVTRTLWPVVFLTVTRRTSAWPFDFLLGHTPLCRPRTSLAALQTSPSAWLAEYTGQQRSFV